RSTFRFMTRNEAQATTNYTLASGKQPQISAPLGIEMKRLPPLLADAKRLVTLAFVAMILSSLSNLLGPTIIGRTVDRYIQGRNFQGVLINAGFLLLVYLGGLLASYYQTLTMGTVGRTVLFKLRNALFTK